MNGMAWTSTVREALREWSVRPGATPSAGSVRKAWIRPRHGCRGWVGMLLVMTLALALALHGRAESVPGQVLVKLRPGVGGGRLQGSTDLPLPDGARARKESPIPGWVLVELAPGQSMRSAMDWFRRRPEVALAEPNQRYRLHATPADPQWPWLAGLTRIGAPSAWESTVGSSNIVVAILDTGIDLTHPDLRSNLWRNPGEVPGNGLDDDRNGVVDDVWGADFADDDGDPSDDAGHGTHVAGTIGAVANNAEGVAGVCWQVRLLGVRVGRADGFADTFGLASAFDYVVRLRKAGADIRVINCSWGGGSASALLKEAIIAAGEAGMLVVCSAGNERRDNDVLPTFPCGYDSPAVLSVAASADCDELAVFSNFGRYTVHLAAPGRDIVSTYRNGRYAVLSGTSMASPHVSGAAALLASRRPDLTVDQLRALILGTVEVTPDLAGRVASGGRLNLARAMSQLVAGNLPTADAAPIPTAGPPSPGRIAPISRRADGRWANDNSSEPVISGDGRWVAFSSAATNLVPGMDAVGFLHIYLHDRHSNTVVRVSQTPAGAGGRGDSTAPAISADGRFVAFASRASNLSSWDANPTSDVLLWNRETRQIELISVRTDGRNPGNGPSGAPVVSADGSVVAFQSEARDLVANDRNMQSDVFLRDRNRGVTERVSVTSGGAEANGPSDAPSVSADGRVVAFHSAASNLVADDANRAWDIFVRDRVTAIVERASVTGRATAGDSDSVYPFLSADGRFVAFHSLAANFDAAGGGFIGVFIRDRVDGTLRRANAVAGSVAGGDAFIDGFSADGRWVTFTTDDPVLGPGAAPGFFRGWMFDARTGAIGQFGVNAGGYDPDNNTFYGRPSADGRYVVFTSYGSNPVAGNGSGLGNVYVEDFGTARPDLAVRPLPATGSRPIGLGTLHPSVPQRVLQSVDLGSTAAFEVTLVNVGAPQAYRLALSWPGGSLPSGWVIRATTAASTVNLVPTLSGEGWVTPVLPTASNLVLRVEIDRAAAGTGEPALAARWTASAADPGSTVLDAVTTAAETRVLLPQGRELVSRAWDGTPAARSAEAPAVSRNGRWVAFSSEADHLVNRSDTNFQSDIFLYDRETREVRRVSDASETDQADADSRYPSLSADGRWVAFQSRASNLVSGDTNQVDDVFVKDLTSGLVTRGSVSSQGRQGNRGSDSALLSADGRFLAFTSLASNLVSGDDNHSADVFLRHQQTGELEWISRAPGGAAGDADSEIAAISADGRFVLFNSYAANLGPPDTNRTLDAYLLDRALGTLQLVSMATNGVAANGPSRGTSVSDDGQWVTFSSLATDLGTGQGQPSREGYILHRPTGRLHTADSLLPTGAISSLLSRGATVAPDGLSWGIAARRACGGSWVPDQVVAGRRFANGTLRLTPVSGSPDGTPAEDHSFVGRFSPDGRYLAFESHSSRVLGDFSRGAGQVFLSDTAIPGVALAAKRAEEGPWRGATGAGGSDVFLPPISLATHGGDGSPARFTLRIQNRGSMPERLRIHAVRPVSGVSLIRIQARTVPPGDITDVVFGQGWESPALQPDEGLDLDVTVGLVAGPTADGVLDLQVEWGPTGRAGRTSRLVALADADGDGLPDAWETRYFGGLETADAGTDADQDGLGDRSEWQAGTDPREAGSGVRLRVEAGRGGGGPGIAWSTEADRYYLLEVSVPGADERFQPVGEPIWSAAAGGTRVIGLGPGGPDGRAVYRLRVDLP